MQAAKPPVPQPGLSNAQKIVEFHEAVGAPVPPQPVVPSLEILQLREKLLQEEFAEASEEWQKLTAVCQSGNHAQPIDVTLNIVVNQTFKRAFCTDLPSKAECMDDQIKAAFGPQAI